MIEQLYYFDKNINSTVFSIQTNMICKHSTVFCIENDKQFAKIKQSFAFKIKNRI